MVDSLREGTTEAKEKVANLRIAERKNFGEEKANLTQSLLEEEGGSNWRADRNPQHGLRVNELKIGRKGRENVLTRELIQFESFSQFTLSPENVGVVGPTLVLGLSIHKVARDQATFGDRKVEIEASQGDLEMTESQWESLPTPTERSVIRIPNVEVKIRKIGRETPDYIVDGESEEERSETASLMDTHVAVEDMFPVGETRRRGVEVVGKARKTR